MDYPKSLSDVYLHDGKFTDGTADGSVSPSRDPAKWNNDVTDSILNVQAWTGEAPNEADPTQLKRAIDVRIDTKIAANSFSIPALPAAAAAGDHDELAVAISGTHKRISVGELFTGRTGVDQIARDMAITSLFQHMISGTVAAGTFADWARINTFPTDNLPTKTGATYNATDKTYGNSGPQVMISAALGTPIGTITGNGGVAVAFNGVTSATAGSSGVAYRNDSGNPQPGYIGKDWGSGTGKIVSGFKVYGSADLGFEYNANPTITATLMGSNSNDPTTATSLGSASATDAGGIVISKLSGLTTTTAYRYHWIKFSGNVTDWHVAEVEFFETSASGNMTLVDSPYSVPASPLDARVYFLHAWDSAGALNIDIKAFMARDGSGAGGWVQGTLTLQDAFVFGTSWNVLVADFDLSSLPTGTMPLIKIETYNTVTQRLRGMGVVTS